MPTALLLTLFLLGIHAFVCVGWYKRGWEDDLLPAASIPFGLYFFPCAWFFGVRGLVSPPSIIAWLIYFGAFHRPIVTTVEWLTDTYQKYQEEVAAERLRSQHAAEAAQRQAEAERQARAYDQFAGQFEPAVSSIVLSERRLIEAFRSVDVTVDPIARATCREIITRAMRGRGDGWSELQKLIASLDADTKALRACVQQYNTAIAALGMAKEAIIQNQSATLLDELDAISSRLNRRLHRRCL